MALTQLAGNLPYTLVKLSADDLCDKYSCIISNLNASKKPYNVAGKSQLGQFMFVPIGAKIHMAVGFCSTGPYMSVSCYAEQTRMKNPQEIVDIFVRKNKENIAKMLK